MQLLIAATTALAISSGFAQAQTVGPDEALGHRGSSPPGLNSGMAKVTLTPAQENAIYNAVIAQRVKPPAARITAAVGAPVPRTAELGYLPNLAAADPTNPDDPDATLLKYAMVGGDVVVVDPIGMRVVDVIRDKAKP